MALIPRLPIGFHDITSIYLTNPNDVNGINDVTIPFQNAINYCRDNDLTLCLPENTRYRIINTLKWYQTDAAGQWVSDGAFGLVGENRGGTKPEIFLDSGASANGFGIESLSHKPMIHFLKSKPIGGVGPTVYPPVEEDAMTFFAFFIKNIKLTGGGFGNCHILHADGAQDCSISDVDIDATDCYCAISGWPGRGSATRNINITGINYKYGFKQEHPYAGTPNVALIGLGCLLYTSDAADE